MVVNAVCVFCGAQNAVEDEYKQTGRDLGAKIAKSGKKLVYGGGDCGIMGAVANATLQNKGHAIGVFPRSLRNLEEEHKSLSEIHIVDTMHERKQLMYEKSDIFLIFPGGCGTLDEMFEILTWKQLGLHNKRIVIFNYKGYWDHLVKMLDTMLERKFAREETRSMYEVMTTLEEIYKACDM